MIDDVAAFVHVGNIFAVVDTVWFRHLWAFVWNDKN